MNNWSPKKEFFSGVKKMYALPKRNPDFAWHKALIWSFVEAPAYGFFSFWVATFIGATQDQSLTVAVISGLAAGVFSILFSKWKTGWALEELTGPILMIIVFVIAWVIVTGSFEFRVG